VVVELLELMVVKVELILILKVKLEVIQFSEQLPH
jgi:hypothetical protein